MLQGSQVEEQMRKIFGLAIGHLWLQSLWFKWINGCTSYRSNIFEKWGSVDTSVERFENTEHILLNNILRTLSVINILQFFASLTSATVAIYCYSKIGTLIFSMPPHT